MATKNFFDLLGDDENEDPSQVVVRANLNSVEWKPAAGEMMKLAAPSKMPTKVVPPLEAVNERRKGLCDGAGGGRGGVRVGRGGHGNHGDRDGPPREGGYRERSYINDRTAVQALDADGFVGARDLFVEKPVRAENGEGRLFDGGRGGGRGRGRGVRGHCEGEERPRRREFDRHSGNGRGNETEKRAGAGRGNWGTGADRTLILSTVEAVKDAEAAVVEGSAEMKPEQVLSVVATGEEGAAEVIKEEDEDDIEMTLEEYEKVLEGKRKALEAEKASERKVEVDKAFEKMQLVENKKREDDVFIKLGQDKEKVKREVAEREEKSRKPVSINEFLKPVEGEKYYGPPSNRGRGGRGGRGERREVGGRGIFGGGRVGGSRGPACGPSAPKIEDQAQFPTLGGK